VRRPRLSGWRRSCGPICSHREPGYAVVNIPGDVPGDCSSEQMDRLADLAERLSFSEIRVTHGQNLVLPHVRLDDAPDLRSELEAIGLATADIALAHRI
jgi:sulfite reductase (NADPH) hemoprotein beta-component